MKLDKIFLFLSSGLLILIIACTGTASDDVKTGETNQAISPPITELEYLPPALEPTVVHGYPAPPVMATVEYSYPAPPELPSINSSGYPEPNSDQTGEVFATPGPIPRPDSTSGVVVGTIQTNNEPILNLTIYLAKVLVDVEGKEKVIPHDRATSPQALTDERGQFVFSNIQPGNYGLVIDTVLSSYLLHLPQEDVALIITVEAGEATSIELLNYDSLPIPQTE